MIKGNLLFTALTLALVSHANAQSAPTQPEETASQSTTTTLGAASPDAAATTLAAPEASSTAALSTTVPTARPYKVTLLTSHFAGMKNTNEGRNAITALHQVRAEYTINANEKIRLNQVLVNEYGSDATASGKSLQIGDLYAQYSRAKLADLGSHIFLNTYLRAYAPLSKGSKAKNQVTALRLDAELAKNINKTFDVALHVIPWVTYNRTSSYDTTGADGAVTSKANSPFNLAYYGVVSANLTSKIYFAQEAGLMRYWYQSDAAKGIASTQKEFLYLDSSVNYTISKTFEVGLGLSSYLARDMLAQKNDFAIYRADETDYYMTASAAF